MSTEYFATLVVTHKGHNYSGWESDPGDVTPVEEMKSYRIKIITDREIDDTVNSLLVSEFTKFFGTSDAEITSITSFHGCWKSWPTNDRTIKIENIVPITKPRNYSFLVIWKNDCRITYFDKKGSKPKYTKTRYLTKNETVIRKGKFIKHFESDCMSSTPEVI